MIGMPPGVEGTSDDELFPEWDEYLRMEDSGPQEPLIDVGIDGGSRENQADDYVNGSGKLTKQPAEVDAVA